RLRGDPDPRRPGFPGLRHPAHLGRRVGLRPEPGHLRRGLRHLVDRGVPRGRDRAARARGDPGGGEPERPGRPPAADPQASHGRGEHRAPGRGGATMSTRTPAPGDAPDPGGSAVVDIRDLRITFATDADPVRAVDGVHLAVRPGEVLAVVGESGSGKTVTGKSILGLLPETATVAGAVLLDGRDVTRLGGAQLRQVRGRDAAMVFQEPSSALNPLYTIGWQLIEGLRAHGMRSTKAARAKAIEVLGRVGIPDPQTRVDHYPHQFSGGQKQRIVIAMALVLGSKVIVADEPTTALDVTVQAEILDLLRRVRTEFDTAIVLITHNMGV